MSQGTCQSLPELMDSQKTDAYKLMDSQKKTQSLNLWMVTTGVGSAGKTCRRDLHRQESGHDFAPVVDSASSRLACSVCVHPDGNRGRRQTHGSSAKIDGRAHTLLRE